MIEGVADVFAAFVDLKVLIGQEELRHLEMILAEAAVIDLHEASLADCGAGLEHASILGTPGEIEGVEAGPHRSAGDHEHLVPLLGNVRHRLDQPTQDRMIKFRRHLTSQYARPHLDHDSLAPAIHQAGKFPCLGPRVK